MKTAAVYIRVSTDKQEELSPESQLDKVMEYAKRMDGRSSAYKSPDRKIQHRTTGRIIPYEVFCRNCV